jgi:hypothetical protein
MLTFKKPIYKGFGKTIGIISILKSPLPFSQTLAL